MQIPWLDLFYLGVLPLILIHKFRLSLRCCCHKGVRIAILAGKGTGKGSKSGSKLHPSGILWAKGPANGSGGIFLQVTTEGVPQCFVSGPMGVSKYSCTLKKNIKQLGGTFSEYASGQIHPALIYGSAKWIMPPSFQLIVMWSAPKGSSYFC